MVFSFFKKQPTKMPERPAAKPRAPDPQPEPAVRPAAAEEDVAPLPEPLPELEFTRSNVGLPRAPSGKPAVDAEAAAPVADDFAIDDFDHDDFTESSVMGIDVDQDVDPLQACVEQVVVLYANGQDSAARSLLETFVRAYHGAEGKRFWLLMFDLLQQTGERAAFDKLAVDFAETFETSPPAWRPPAPAEKKPEAAGNGQRKVFLQGVLTSDGNLPVTELAKLVEQKVPTVVECGKLIGCDDDVAGQFGELLYLARRRRQSLQLVGIEAFIDRLNGRLVAGEAAHEPAWRLLLELLQRHGKQELFEERAIDYAVTFELSPPSWEPVQAAGPVAKATATPTDGAYYLSGDIKGCRFEELAEVIDATEPAVIDFSGVRRLDFVSAGQLVNRLAPFKAAGREIVIRSPNHLVAELMAVVGLNKMARIIVRKS